MAENMYVPAPVSPHEDGFMAPFCADEEPPYIFISYAHEDRKRVFPIITRLYEQGWRIWYDEGIPPATNYNDVIANHIVGCSLFLMFVTRNACERPYVIDNEVEYAIRCKPGRILLCFLEEDIEMPRGADMLLGGMENPKYPKAGEHELENALAGVDGLIRGESRKAVAFKHDSGSSVLTTDSGEYAFDTLVDGIRLTRYRGSDTDVVVPAECPAGSGQKVVELEKTFRYNETVRTVRLPATVGSIKSGTFASCEALTDVYIPSSVAEIDDVFGWKKFSGTIHCAEDSAALEYAKEENIAYIIDNSMRVSDKPMAETVQSAYAFVSYSPDMSRRAAEIIGALKQLRCTVLDGNELSGTRAMKAARECACFVALASRGYLGGEDIEFLRTAQAMNKPKLIYVLEACQLPPDLSIVNESQQQLRYDALNEEQRTAKLVEWLQKYGCRRTSVKIPDFEYTATAEGGITLTKYTGSGGNVVIEREYGDPPFRLPVTGIGNRAFHDCRSMTGVTIPGSVTSIGAWAFEGCSSLTNISVPDSVMSIGGGAFRGCRNLTGITIPGGVEKIGRSAFANCSRLTDITIPDSVTKIGDKAFESCRSLTGITIPGGVTSIGGWAFCGCHNLTSITVFDGVMSIGDSAFRGCRSLTSITVPSSVTSIGDWAFSRCSSLTAITIPDSVTSIGNSAFNGCSSLTAITIPGGVERIGRSAFANCSSLTGISVSYTNETYCDIDGVLFSKDKTRLIVYPGGHGKAYSVPDSVTSIDGYAFGGCRSLTAITVPDSVTSIGWAAFNDCSRLTVYCSENSNAWQYCKEAGIRYKPLSARAKHSPARWLVPLLILLALAAAAGLQLSGLVDILGLLGL